MVRLAPVPGRTNSSTYNFVPYCIDFTTGHRGHRGEFCSYSCRNEYFSTVSLENNKENRDKSIFYLPLYHSIFNWITNENIKKKNMAYCNGYCISMP